MIIITNNFTLRPLRKSDAKNIAKYINDKTVYDNTFRIPYPYKLKDAKEWLEKTISQYRKKKPAELNFGIEIGGEIVGCVGLKEIQGGHKAELGYWLAKKYRGKGIMSLVVGEVVDYGFKEFSLKRIYAYAFLHNEKSQKVLKKNGFKKEGTLKKEVMKDSKYFDEIIMAKIK